MIHLSRNEKLILYQNWITKENLREKKKILFFHFLWTKKKNGWTDICKDKEKWRTFEGEISRIDTHLRKNITTKKN